jgi:ABC-type transport system involved in cytochrome bd biosynthesis fused ATPase/permease subunit
MQPVTDNDSISIRDAEARLRYLNGVREQVHRRTLSPGGATAVLGAVLVIHALLPSAWSRSRVTLAVWVVAAIAVRPIVRWVQARSADRRGVHGRTRLRLACGAAGWAGIAAALILGADRLITAITAAIALATYLSGFYTLTAAVIAVGIAGDIGIAHGLARSTAELIVGAGLLAAGVAGRLNERDDR